MDGHANRIDPNKWSPLIVKVRKFYGLNGEYIHPTGKSV